MKNDLSFHLLRGYFILFVSCPFYSINKKLVKDMAMALASNIFVSIFPPHLYWSYYSHKFWSLPGRKKFVYLSVFSLS